MAGGKYALEGDALGGGDAGGGWGGGGGQGCMGS